MFRTLPFKNCSKCGSKMRHFLYRRAPWLVFASLLITISLLDDAPADNVTSHIYYYFYPDKSIYCYREEEGKRLPDISDAEVRKGKSIFFHETSCRSRRNGKITLLSRQACAVESAARANPNFDVYLTFSSPGTFRFEDTESDRMLRRLLDYPNVKIFHLNYRNYTRNTPLEELYSSGRLETSFYAQSHASDVLRYLSLYKYGGIYLDMDVIVVKSLENLPPNYAGIETDRNVAAGVLSLSHKGVGHEHALSCILDLKRNFKTRGWGDNGPGVITRLLRKLCGVQLGKDMVNRDCHNFTVYPTPSFYPVPWEQWKMYFDEDRLNEVLEMTESSYVVHVWNKHSEGTKLPVNGDAPYTVFARRHCPKVFKECDSVF